MDHSNIVMQLPMVCLVFHLKLLLWSAGLQCLIQLLWIPGQPGLNLLCTPILHERGNCIANMCHWELSTWTNASVICVPPYNDTQHGDPFQWYLTRLVDNIIQLTSAVGGLEETDIKAVTKSVLCSNDVKVTRYCAKVTFVTFTCNEVNEKYFTFTCNKVKFWRNFSTFTSLHFHLTDRSKSTFTVFLSLWLPQSKWPTGN